MPESIARTEEVAFQASLFSEEESAEEPSRSRTSKADLSKEILTDSDIKADSVARPRQRLQLKQKNETSNFKSADRILNLESDSNSSINKDIKRERPSFTHHSQLDPNELTPVLRHYVELKIANPKRILLYRLGDFFECFFEDAITLSRELELALTGKDAGKTIGRVPMAGIPHQTAERFCSDLIRLGYSVALCDQLEAVPAKGSLLKRDITRVLTPGTVQEEGMLSARCNNWLAAVVVEPPNKQKGFCWGLAQADVSTGEVKVMQKEGAEGLQQQLAQLEASELLWSGDDISPSWCPDRVELTRVSSTPFSRPEAKFSICQHYKLANLDGLGLQELPLALQAMGGLIRYVHDTQPLNEDNRVPLEVPEIVRSNDTLVLDTQTRRNLELTTTQRDGVLQGSLLWSIDRTLTAMGSRCLRRWIEAPLMDLIAIEQRQAVISSLVNQRSLRKAIRVLLRPMGDLERLAGRSGAGYAGARELVAIADGLERLPKLAAQLTGKLDAVPPWFQALLNPHPKLKELAAIVTNTLVESPPLSLNEGGLILDLVDPLLDGLRNQLDDQDAWLSQQETKERQRSGINTLRLQHHRTFGYYLSVSKAKAESVPENWIRRQTLANEERFITPELKEREGLIFQLRARKCQLEYELFVKLRIQVGATAALIREAARAVASLDALAGLAEVAATNNFCQPALCRSRELTLTGARHPVVEQLLVDTTFISNDVNLGSNTDLVVLTGPNASGKSCYLRQIGLIQLMAQIGSWVPAKSARIGITDRIFTRVGAVDDLAAGQSTFMVEMAETANILHHATSNSLVLLDEIGRGTATFDGLSIAWAVSEYLAGELLCRSVFATHYHELNALADTFSNVSNFQVLVKETGEDLVFLHKVSPGGASRSYGIEVARLAGVPRKVIKRARQILDKLGN